MKKINTVATIPYTAAAAQALQVGHAGFVLLGPFGGLLGGILGVTITLSVTNAASRITEIAKGRRWLAYVGLVGLLLVAPVMVGPSAYLSFGVIPEAWLRIVAAVAWAVAPDVCMILSGAIAGKSLVKQDDKPAQVVVKHTRKPERKTVNRAELVEYLRGNPGASKAAIARAFGVSRQAIAQRLESITPAELGLTK